MQDIVALVVQAIGGATASRAVKTDGDPEKVRILNKSIYRSFLTMAYVQGGHIMLAGIVFQMGKLTIVGSYPYRSYDIFSRNHHLCYTRLGVHPPLLVEQSHTEAGSQRRISSSAFGQADEAYVIGPSVHQRHDLHSVSPHSNYFQTYI